MNVPLRVLAFVLKPVGMLTMLLSWIGRPLLLVELPLQQGVSDQMMTAEVVRWT